MQGQERMEQCQWDNQDLSVYTWLQCNAGAVLQSFEASENLPEDGAMFGKFKCNFENQIVTNSINDVSQSIHR